MMEIYKFKNEIIRFGKDTFEEVLLSGNTWTVLCFEVGMGLLNREGGRSLPEKQTVA